MTEMLTRQVQDNRLIRAAPTFETTLGQTVGASFAAAGRQTLGTLALGELSQPDEFAGFTDIQGDQVKIGDVMRGRELTELQSDLNSESDPVRRVEMINRVNELKGGREEQIDAYTREAVDAGRMQSKDALAEMYGDLGLTFDRAMTQEDADLLAQDKREEIIRQAIIEAGPKGIIPGAARFGAGLAAMAVDPLEVATMFIPVVGVAGRAASVSRFGRVGGRTVVGATEGLVGSALTEPFIYTMSRSQQLDYTMTDALMNVGLGAVLGGGLGTVIGAFSKRVSRVDTQTEAANVALRQFIGGQTVAPRAIASTADFMSRLKNSVVVSGSGAPLRVFHGTASAFTEFDASRGGYSTGADSAKAGVWFSSDARVAGSYATYAAEIAPINRFDEDIRRLEISGDAADLDDVMDRAFQFEESVKTDEGRKLGQNIFPAYLDLKNPAIVDAKGEIPEGIGGIEKYIRQAKEGGHDGLIIKNLDDSATFANAVSDHYLVFDPGDIVSVFQRADPADLARNASDPHLDPLANFDASARADMEVPDQFTDEAIAEMEAAVNALDESGTLSAEARADLDAIKEVNQHSKTYADASRAMATCMVGV